MRRIIILAIIVSTVAFVVIRVGSFVNSTQIETVGLVGGGNELAK